VLDRLAGPGDVLRRRARQAADDRLRHFRRDRAHRLEIAIGCDREARLDDVDAHLLEVPRDLDFFRAGKRRAGALFAVAQRRVEDSYVVLVHDQLLKTVGIDP
jgi:hypothetical protein